ncbi:MAG: radical SAM protein [Alphaproteobacteria bacterium]|nr:radical SAM protein [Alphaproteobacteria bacterium]MBF0249266.1 radical SAM protein [Alphaproteobacteria bacterium]
MQKDTYLLDSVPEIQFYLVEITTACQLRCPGCKRTTERGKKNWSSNFMPLEKVKRVIDNMPPSNHVIFSGFGEVTLHPNLPDILSYANKSGKFRIIQINTNGLINDIDYFRMLIDCGLNYLMISVDSLDQKILDASRTGTKAKHLETVLRGMADFRIPVIASITVSKTNLDDLPNTLRRLNEIGKFTVGIREAGDLGLPDVMLDADDRVRLAKHLVSVMPLDNLRVDPPKSMMVQREVCVDPWNRPGINIKGELTPCCWTNDGSILGHLDITSMTYEDAWFEQGHQNWLNGFREAYPENPCSGCPRNPNLWSSFWTGKDFVLYRTLK